MKYKNYKFNLVSKMFDNSVIKMFVYFSCRKVSGYAGRKGKKKGEE